MERWQGPRAAWPDPCRRSGAGHRGEAELGCRGGVGSTSGAQGVRVLRWAHVQAIGTQPLAEFGPAAPARVIFESHYQGFHLANEHTPVMPVDGPVASSKDTQPHPMRGLRPMGFTILKGTLALLRIALRFGEKSSCMHASGFFEVVR
jgi:hypothetical protein